MQLLRTIEMFLVKVYTYSIHSEQQLIFCNYKTTTTHGNNVILNCSLRLHCLL